MRPPAVTAEDRATADLLGIPGDARLGRAVMTMTWPSLPVYRVDWLGVELEPAPVSRPTPWPVIVDGALRAPSRVLQGWQRVASREGSSMRLVAIWHPDNGRTERLEGLAGQSSGTVCRFLRDARYLLLRSEVGGRPPGARGAARRPVIEAIRAKPTMTDAEIVDMVRQSGALPQSTDDWVPSTDQANLAKRVARLRRDALG